VTLRPAQGHPEQRRGVRIFGIDPGSECTGYGCVESDGRRHYLVGCGAVRVAPSDAFPARLARIHRELTSLLATMRPDGVAVENLFSAANARSALRLGHARGVAILAAVQAGCEVFEYTPAEVKRSVVGYGRADKQQVQQMVRLLLGLEEPPAPYDAADALAVAICHLHALPSWSGAGAAAETGRGQRGAGRSWRLYRPAAQG
jgi:crossover junction endodeoxyribonuclease RuvC